jgi:hypothetical protein
MTGQVVRPRIDLSQSALILIEARALRRVIASSFFQLGRRVDSIHAEPLPRRIRPALIQLIQINDFQCGFGCLYLVVPSCPSSW